MRHASHEERIKQLPAGLVAALPAIAGGLSVASTAFSLLNRPKAPNVPAPPTLPTPLDTQGAADEQRRQRLAGGRASTVLTGAEGLSMDSGGLASRSLLS